MSVSLFQSSTLRQVGAWQCACMSTRCFLLSACVDEGALSFVTTMCSSYRDYPYKRGWGMQNDRGPSSKPAAGTGSQVPVMVCVHSAVGVPGAHLAGGGLA